MFFLSGVWKNEDFEVEGCDFFPRFLGNQMVLLDWDLRNEKLVIQNCDFFPVLSPQPMGIGVKIWQNWIKVLYLLILSENYMELKPPINCLVHSYSWWIWIEINSIDPNPEEQFHRKDGVYECRGIGIPNHVHSAPFLASMLFLSNLSFFVCGYRWLELMLSIKLGL